MNFKLPNEVTAIINKFKNANYQIFIVGGAVRDLLMGRGVKDWDFTTDAKPEEVLKLFPKAHYNNKFGTVGVGNFEITTMRKEREYADFRHPDKVFWTYKIEEDLARRDFTVNSIALSDSMNIIDPFHGQQDLKDKLIRAVGDPNARFKEDALRLIRAIRISTELGFDIEKNTLEAIKKNAQLIKKVSSERVRDELFKILEINLGQGADMAYSGIVKLKETGILQIILPELEKCFGLVQEGPKRARVYDIGEHCLLTLKHTPSSDPITLLAALLHDIGKPKTVAKDKEGNVTFHHHDVVGGRIVLQIAKRFNLSKAQTDKLFKLVRWHMFNLNENQTDSAVRRFIKNVGRENIDDLFALRIGDRLGGGTKTATSWRMEAYKQRIKQVLHKPFSITDLKVGGRDVMEALGIKPGPKVGKVLQKLFEEVLEDPSKNTREYLLDRIRAMNQEFT